MISATVFFFLASASVLVFAKPHNEIVPTAEEEATLAFLECIRKALDGGLEAAEIPDHNPFVSWRNITLPLDQVGADGTLFLHNMYIEDIVDFEPTKIEGVNYDDGLEFTITYELYWKQMRIHGDFIADYKQLLIHHHYEGTFNVTLEDLTFSGLWDMTTAPTHRRLVDLTIALGVSDVDAKVKGTGLINDPLIGAFIGAKAKDWINSNADIFKYTLVPLLRDRINDNWMEESHTYRIDAILENCK